MKRVDDEFIVTVNKKCYDNLGADYVDGAADFRKLIEIGSWQEFLDGLSGKKVLDAGCGAGDAAKWLVDRGFEVTACDLSTEMVKVARRKVPGAEIIEAGATELEKLAERKYDGVVSTHLIQHLSRAMMKKFFESVYDLLGGDGRFFLVFTNTCYAKTGYQLDGEKEGNYIF